ncbi:hypothetical protein SEVIR_6G088500v4 [Setaria viridis]|uniref:Methyltransferase type 11 domain-containing protein n=1 Tax=Setaria viridis TaxID=4556 RepID=A0A4U6U1L9_SETVI|nr:uncharacterized protein LOC117861728 [Setaria viridis]TKW09348.1 hypothetical protein SEVIR_6G088500v2 [Setaria viridis]
MEAADLLDGNGKNKPPPQPRRRRWYCSTTAVTLLMFLLTNTVSIVVSSGAGPSLLRRYKPSTIRLWDGSAALLADLNATQADLAASRAELAGLYARVGTANELLRTLLDAMAARDAADIVAIAGGWKREPSGELKLAVGPHNTSMTAGHGRNATGEAATAVFPALGHGCVRVQDDLERYMNYTPGGECPSDEALAHRLMRSGCEPLTRRRCRAPSPKGYRQPSPLPTSLWVTPPDTSVLWDAYYPCKNYSCLASSRGVDLRRVGREKARWARDDGALSYSIATVLATRPNGTVRVGLDLAGGRSSYSPGTFAARMLDHGVTVVTAAVSAAAPLNSFVASRGLVSVHVTAAHRLPFFDRTLDIVHAAAGGLGDGGGSRVPADVMLEFALFDVYRVLRPGGLFWLDHFPCPGAQLNATVAPMLGRVGFKKLRWNTGRGKEKDQWYVSALLEKPMA